ncbi:hypothetical protein IMZ38_01610 [Thermosphaera chiliense]|uniref:Uncharacterized protein n=1 Tax=Thermosphaera chiliense TaxID=3402707 RepID=A0A7M1UQX1_9CREN|nr:hypothetical protein [Thermosphaera aggregans]QOR94658.1 hypothetical protein IMZ38_01610 [Thermosphaera aggregans]
MEKALDGEITSEELNHTINLTTLVKGLYNEVPKFYFIKYDEIYRPYKQYINDTVQVTDHAFNLGLKLCFDKESTNNATVEAITYYNIVVEKDNLQEDLEARFINKRNTGQKYRNNLVDFEPTTIIDATGNTILIESFDKARDTWMITHLLKQKSKLVNQPKKFG